jgi:hypothetical protein
MVSAVATSSSGIKYLYFLTLLGIVYYEGAVDVTN